MELWVRLSLVMGGVGFRILEDAILAGIVGGTLDGRAIALALLRAPVQQRRPQRC